MIQYRPQKPQVKSKKRNFIEARYSAGFWWFSIDSIALKSMLELCFDSFKTNIDRDHRAGRWEGGGPGTRRTKSRPDQSKSIQNPDQRTEKSENIKIFKIFKTSFSLHQIDSCRPPALCASGNARLRLPVPSDNVLDMSV